ncbi:hypothetical protein RDI58_018002 [Solanum bulbocastanum]|uniref:Uncharacterized protein n=1 Tax=Solanum bulbocastanum TaxID=147425 RepID=A0AAN8TG34_SOLBU
MLESQLNPLAIESVTISENEIMQLLTDDEANSKSDYNDNKLMNKMVTMMSIQIRKCAIIVTPSNISRKWKRKNLILSKYHFFSKVLMLLIFCYFCD